MDEWKEWNGMDGMQWKTIIRRDYLCPANTVLLYCIVSRINRSTFQKRKVKMILMVIGFSSFQFLLIYWLNLQCNCGSQYQL